MRWAYDVLGWGGYWAWDPVEIACPDALADRNRLPALGHDPGKAGHVQTMEYAAHHLDLCPGHLWHLPYPLRRAFIRACVRSKRHRTDVLCLHWDHLCHLVALLIYRWKDLRAEVEMHSLFSREALFLLNNLLFMGVLIVCFWGVIFPLISELVTGRK